MGHRNNNIKQLLAIIGMIAHNRSDWSFEKILKAIEAATHNQSFTRGLKGNMLELSDEEVVALLKLKYKHWRIDPEKAETCLEESVQ